MPKSRITPKLVIHGGAGNITKANLPPPAHKVYLTSLSNILKTVFPDLSDGNVSALDAVVHAVRLFEDNPIFNAGKGAVFTLDGHNELEASVMVSRGNSKRGVGVFFLRRVKNPILFAKEVLLRDNPVGNGGGADGTRHNGLSGAYAEKLAGEWGLEIVDPGYFFTQKRWDEHLRSLPKEERERREHERQVGEKDGLPAYPGTNHDMRDLSHEEMEEYLPQGTVGAVALDADGVLAVATSTGGRTNKLPGRIGDTPSLGAGFWAEEFDVLKDSHGILSRILSCFSTSRAPRRACAVSGTGDGDYFLRLAAMVSVVHRCRYLGESLNDAAEAICGIGGEMEKASEHDRKLGDLLAGSAGLIGLDDKGETVFTMNSGGMFRGTVDSKGRVLCAAFREEPLQEFGRIKV